MIEHRTLRAELDELNERLAILDRHRVRPPESLFEALVRVQDLSRVYTAEFGKLSELPESARLTLLRAILAARAQAEEISEPLRRAEIRAAVATMNQEESHL